LKLYGIHVGHALALFALYDTTVRFIRHNDANDTVSQDLSILGADKTVATLAVESLLDIELGFLHKLSLVAFDFFPCERPLRQAQRGQTKERAKISSWFVPVVWRKVVDEDLHFLQKYRLKIQIRRIVKCEAKV
jgi:hypothetical protein